MKKILSLTILTMLSLALMGQEKKSPNLAATPYWYLNLGYESPFMNGDMYSITNSKINFGIGPNIRLGYRFSPIFGLELKALYGVTKGESSQSASKYWLGSDGMTYYPYTLVDGSDYTTDYNPGNNSTPFFGIWGNNNVGISGVRYGQAYSKSQYIQLGLMGSLNLNRIFMYVPKDREQRITFFLKPGVFVNKFYAAGYAKSSDKMITPKYKSPLTLGLGGELAMNCAITHNLGLELYSGIMWVSDNNFDGIKTIKMAKDSYIWTVGANLSIKFAKRHNEVCKCVEPVVEEVVVPKQTNALVVEEPKVYNDFAFTALVPTLGVRKVRTITEKAMFRFNTSKTNLVPSLGDNQMYLNQIENSYKKLMEDKDIRLTNISVKGYASPEGPLKANNSLAYNRAKSIVDYLIANYNYPKSIMSYEGEGEDWNGLKAALEAWNMPGKSALLKIVDSNAPVATKKKQLINCGKIYKEALHQLYPQLRKNECVFTFEIRPYTVAECVKKINTTPEKLSADEMIAVANQYPMYSPEFNTIVDKAIKYFPTDTKVLCYKAAILLKENKGAEAIPYLLKAGKDANVCSLLGVAYMQTGDKAKALKYLNMAKNQGNTDAQINIQKLEINK